MPPREVERLGFVARRQVRDAAAGRVGGRAAESLGVDILVGDGLHDVRAGHEHVARALDHHRESVIAGEYTAPPAHGPRMTEICGTTPEARTLRRKMSA